MGHRTVVAMLACVCALSSARPGHACGGTFCDRPPAGSPAMPVDQSGENIVFYMSDGFVEAHVQIQYTGDPARFAWVVPMPAAPEVSVGSQRLLDAVLAGTRPTLTVSNGYESCTDGSSSTYGGCGMSSSGPSDDRAAFDDSRDTANIGAKEQETQQIGAFDVTILEPTDASEITSWLENNGFLDAPDAPNIVQSYVDEGSVFVAVKFAPGVGVSEIHPLVFRYAGSEPCIPLRLTRIAATEDMPVRAFFLGDRRVFPTNYAHVVLNPAHIDWPGLGSNYVDVVSRAVDEAEGGLGFVTEYAGSSAVIDDSNVLGPSWNADVFRTAEPAAVWTLLESQGLVACTSTSGCEALHPLVLPLVRKYLPAPADMSELGFYSCLRCNADRIDQDAWDGNAFADELTELVIDPGHHAATILAGTTYVSRLLTTVSPREMTMDPMFAQQPANQDVVSSNLQATLYRHCNGDAGMRGTGLPDYALDGGSAPKFSGMPYAERVETYDDDGSLVDTDDRTSRIENAIAEWNDRQHYPPPPPTRSQRSRSSQRASCTVATPLALGQADLYLLVGVTALARRLGRRRRGRSSGNHDRGHGAA